MVRRVIPIVVDDALLLFGERGVLLLVHAPLAHERNFLGLVREPVNALDAEVAHGADERERCACAGGAEHAHAFEKENASADTR